MILALSLLACGTQSTVPPETNPDDVTPPMSTLAMDIGHDVTNGVTFTDHPEVANWSLSLVLVESGRRNTAPVAAALPIEQEGRTAYDRGDFVDWFENRDEGVKHGIDVQTRPNGQGRLRFVYDVITDLDAEQDERGVHFVDANNQVLFHYTDIVTYDAEGNQLPSEMQLDCSGDVCTIALVVDDSDATYPITIDPLAFSNENVLTSPAGVPDSGVAYGYSVDVDGDFAVVGAPLVDTGGTNRGAAYVYERSGDSWALTQTIAGQNNNEDCGRSVAISADRILVGCPRAENSGGQNNRGLARVYRLQTGVWTLEQVLLSDDTLQLRSGWSVDLNESGDRAIIGGWGYGNGTSTNQQVGVIAIHERSGTSWTRATVATPTAGTVAFNDRYGYSVGISDNHAVVGAPRTGGAANGGSGRIYFYERNGSLNWDEAIFDDGAPVTNYVDGPNSDARLGFSVAIADETAAAGAPRGSTGNQGSAFVYDFAAGVWTETVELFQTLPRNNDRFGRSVGIAGNTLAVGSGRDDSASTDNFGVGSVVVFEETGGTWTQQVELLTRDEQLNADTDDLRVGWDVAVSGDWVITGSNPRTVSDGVEIETAHLFELTFCTAQTDQVGCDVDLLITEIHPQPNTVDYGEQFVELYNNGTDAVQLEGAVLRIDALGVVIDESFVVQPGEHMVIAQSRDSSENGGIQGIPGVFVPTASTFTLPATGGTVSIEGTDTTTLATMTYSGFATPAASLQLSHDGVDYADPSQSYTATTAGNWCPTFLPYVDGGGVTDFMSPRELNETCGVTFTFDYDYIEDPAAVPPPDESSGSTFITINGNQFISGNGGEGPVEYTATATGQTISITYAGPFTILDSNERGFDESCFTGFTADTSTTVDDDYLSGSFFNLVCTAP